MHHTQAMICGALLFVACGGSPGSSETPATTTTEAASGKRAEAGDKDSKEFQLQESATAEGAHGATPSKISPTKTEAAMKFFVVDKKDNEPIPGIVISMMAPDGTSYYTEETDAAGYGEVLVPVGKTYEIVYLSLGEKDVNAKVTIKDEPRQNIKLTLRYKRREKSKPVATPGPGEPAEASQEVFRLDGVEFKSNSAAILPESFSRLDSVVEYMTHKKSARIQIAGHTDNVGNAKKNKALSEKRAQACRDYLVEKGIDGSRIEAVGYGDEQPMASNDSAEGRQKNRRIEVQEL